MIILKHGGRLEKAASPTETPFDYLLAELKTQPDAHLPGNPAKVTADLKALGAALVDNGGARASAAAPGGPATPVVEVNSNIPAVYTSDITKSEHNPFRGAATLPFNWPIEWDRMTDKGDANEAHFARKIDTRLVDPLHNMVNRGVEPDLQEDAGKPIRQLLRSLAQRNLLRGYLLSIPTGQAMAAAMGIDPLTPAEIEQGDSQAVNDAIDAGGFDVNSPLWFYILKEAEIRADGNSLGELGSRIVVETQIGILRNDPSSYLNADDGPWDPWLGVRLDNGDPIVTIRDFFRFADLPA